jgi:hypothetical protein
VVDPISRLAPILDRSLTRQVLEDLENAKVSDTTVVRAPRSCEVISSTFSWELVVFTTSAHLVWLYRILFTFDILWRWLLCCTHWYHSSHRCYTQLAYFLDHFYFRDGCVNGQYLDLTICLPVLTGTGFCGTPFGSGSQCGFPHNCEDHDGLWDQRCTHNGISPLLGRLCFQILVVYQDSQQRLKYSYWCKKSWCSFLTVIT